MHKRFINLSAKRKRSGKFSAGCMLFRALPPSLKGEYSDFVRGLPALPMGNFFPVAGG